MYLNPVEWGVLFGVTKKSTKSDFVAAFKKNHFHVATFAFSESSYD